MSPPRKRRSSPIVAKDSCATPSLRAGKVETEKHGASDMRLCVGRQLLEYVPLQKKCGTDAVRPD